MSVSRLKAQVEAYVGQTLHTELKLAALRKKREWPAFLSQTYDFSEGQLFGKSFVFMLRIDEPTTPAEMAKHVEQVRKLRDEPVVLILKSLSPISRSRLIALVVPFIVPGNQLYIPMLGMDLREYFRAPKIRSEAQLTPVGQVLLFQHLLYPESELRKSSDFADALKYTAMSMGRAFDEIVECGLATSEKIGRERRIEFIEPRRELFDKARRFLRNPVKRRRYVDCDHHLEERFYLAGESALARYTSLGQPRRKVYACTPQDWTILVDSGEASQVPAEDGEAEFEIWSYEPALLGRGGVVDPLSLMAEFFNDNDERLALAAEELLEGLSW